MKTKKVLTVFSILAFFFLIAGVNDAMAQNKESKPVKEESKELEGKNYKKYKPAPSSTNEKSESKEATSRSRTKKKKSKSGGGNLIKGLNNAINAGSPTNGGKKQNIAVEEEGAPANRRKEVEENEAD